MRGFLGILAVLFVALIGGAIGFQAGVVTNVGAGAATAAPPGWVWWWGFPHFGGFLFGLLFLFLIIGLLSFAFGGRRRGPWARRAYRRGWGYDPMDDPFDSRRQWMADAHRRLHEEEAHRAAQPGQGSNGGSNQAPPAPPAAG